MEKKKCRQSISEEFKLSVIRDYYSSGMSQHACSRKYHLRSYSLLPTWLKKYGEKVKSLSLPAEESMMIIWETAARKVTVKRTRG